MLFWKFFPNSHVHPIDEHESSCAICHTRKEAPQYNQRTSIKNHDSLMPMQARTALQHSSTTTFSKKKMQTVSGSSCEAHALWVYQVIRTDIASQNPQCACTRRKVAPAWELFLILWNGNK